MSVVGILPNPASGKDIRRLVAAGASVDNLEKVKIVRRVLAGLAATGVEQVLLMPDWFDIGRRALEGLRLPFPVTVLEMPLSFTQEDTALAARLMRERRARCLVTVGGDGTNRAAAKESGDVPLLPISTGTNNVFPTPVEGTLAGVAAGLVACGHVAPDACLLRARRLEVEREGRLLDIALVDVAVCTDRSTGARAVWDTSTVSEVIIADVRPGVIGLSSLGAALGDSGRPPGAGLRARLGPGPYRALVPLLPGVIQWVEVASSEPLEVGAAVALDPRWGVLALDGEREVLLTPDTHLTVRLSAEGPWVVDVPAALGAASRAGHFRKPADTGETGGRGP
jgi:hypothetical protein